MPAKELRYLMESMGYVFKNPELLKTALTHRSAGIGQVQNERLEFLGDAVLALCIGTELFNRFPFAKEGQLSRMRANLVRGDSLTKLAMTLELGDYLLLGQGERKTGGQRRSSILEDAMEACIGALYLDGGLEVAQKYISHWFDELFQSFNSELQAMSAINAIDAKSQLQEYLQGQGYEIPRYVLVRTEGLPHAQDFFVRCDVHELSISQEGVAKSRKAAEQIAAGFVLEKIIEENPHAKI
jgi:ribonuclease-3